MRAMVLAAGKGTRLAPLTDTCPKALVEIGGRTMLEITLERLRAAGVTDVILNVYHLADRVIEHVIAHNGFGLQIEISREDVLLDTGGGLRKAAWFFLEDRERLDEPFFLHNVDVLSTIDLNAMRRFHVERGAAATLAVLGRPTARPLLFDAGGRLAGHRVGTEVRNVPGTVPAGELEFTGIHVLSPRLLPLMDRVMHTEATGDRSFPIVPAYLKLAAAGEKILAFRTEGSSWRDVGTPESLAAARAECDPGGRR